jgi:hypothetical protein
VRLGARRGGGVAFSEVIEDGPMTELLIKAFEQISKLPADRQDELAQMLIDVAESDRLLAKGEYSLTPAQWAEVDAAIEENDFLSEEETKAFLAKLTA